MIVTYEDGPQPFYRQVAERTANYFSWNKRGDFGKVRVVSESNLGPANAWKKRPDLIQKMKRLGRGLAMELKRKVS
jgi:hypothetical protein